MEQPPLEHAGRALHKLYTEERVRSGAADMPTWEELGKDGQFCFTHRARAVLQAIREPNEAMRRAGDIDIPAQSEATECWQYALGEDDAVKVWQAMIDAALE